MNEREYRRHAGMSQNAHTVYVERRLEDRIATRNRHQERSVKFGARGVTL